jgi:hypothetical protein
MRAIRWILALICGTLLYGSEPDFDCVVVGTSPISMLEALYKIHSGQRVLIIEESEYCGGAWKSIPACCVPHADLGCHQMGSDQNVRHFLEEYVGCRMVALDYPDMDFAKAHSKGSNGFYPSRGCYEMIDNLTKLIQATDAVLMTGSKLESVTIDEARQLAEIKVNERHFTTSKLIVTPCTYLYIENQPSARIPNQHKAKYYHVYLLVEDASPPNFSYRYGIGTGISRLMNLTHFSGLSGTGLQLICIQTHNEHYLSHQNEFFEQIKKAGLLNEDAQLILAESHVYEQSHLDSSMVNQYKSTLIEVLNTGHFLAMASYIGKWKQALKPFKEALGAP